MQVLGRLSLSLGILLVAGLSGWLASVLDQTVFLLGLSVPAISVGSVALIRSETAERRPIDWRVLGGGTAFGTVVLALALGEVPYGQELIFVISMTVICVMLVLVTRDLDRPTRRRSCTPASSYSLSVPVRESATATSGGRSTCSDLDEAFYGILRQTGAVLAFAAMWMFSKQLTEYSVTKVLLWLSIAAILRCRTSACSTACITGHRRCSVSVRARSRWSMRQRRRRSRTSA